MDATADHYFPDPVSGQRGYYFCLAHHGPSSSVLKVNGCLKFPLGLPNESGGDAKKFPLICWLSWWFAIVKIFLFLNYGWSLIFPLVHRQSLKWPQKLLSQTSSHCRIFCVCVTNHSPVNKYLFTVADTVSILPRVQLLFPFPCRWIFFSFFVGRLMFTPKQ